MTLTVAAFDPGVTTGYAIGIIDTDLGVMDVSTEQDKMNVKQLYDRLTVLEPDILVWEKFQTRNAARTGLILFSKELIGVLELYSRMNAPGVKRYDQSAGSVINGYYNNTKLKYDGLYRPGMIHANEACMHLLYWYTFGPGYQYNKIGYRPAVRGE